MNLQHDVVRTGIPSEAEGTHPKCLDHRQLQRVKVHLDV